MRSSIYIEGQNGEKALIDAGPEFRLQAVRAGITRLDAIFLTHAHADHIHGLDDVRPLCRDKPLTVYGNEQTISEVKERFSYIWAETQMGGGKPRLTLIVVNPSVPINIGSLSFTPVPVKHGILDILGWEVEEKSSPDKKRLLYLTDTSAIPPETRRQLSAGTSRIIIIGGLRQRPHETHFCFEQALNTALDIGAKEVYLTHICHDHSHNEIEEFCRNFTHTPGQQEKPGSVSEIDKIEIHPAQDGLEIIL